MKAKLLRLIACWLFASWAYGQEMVVSGVVRSQDDKQPIPGVNVLIKGTSVGASTDLNGKYAVPGSNPEAVLVFSFVGFRTMEVNIANRSHIDVELIPEALQLSEIIVTGVGVPTEKRRTAIEVPTIADKNFVPTAVGSIDQAIQGKIAGAQVQINSGEPGSAAYIQLRGINSLGSSQPIILLDGVQITTITGLDMTNVDHIEVVKGAAGGMLYGAQGANGVIQIFSKRGSKAKRLSVTMSSKYIVDEVLRGPVPLINSMHHYDTDAEGYILSSSGGRIAPDPVTGTWTDPAVSLTSDLKNDKPFKEKTYDQLSQVYRQAHSFNNTLNISGGGEKHDYSLNVNWLNQSNVRFGTLDRKNISLNLGLELLEGFSIRSTTQLQLQTEDLQSENRFALLNANPFIDFDATYANGYKVIKPQSLNGYNPLSEYEWRSRGTNDNRIIQNFNLNYKFPRFVVLDYKYGVQFWNTNSSDITRNQQGYLEPPDAYWGPAPGTGNVYKQNDKSRYQNSLFSIIVNTDFKNDFNLNVPLNTTTQFVYDWRRDDFEQFWGQAAGFPFPPYNLSIGQSKATGSMQTEFITYGYLVNQTINYANLAGISIGFRSDYSSEFGFNSNGASVEPFTFPRGTIFFSPSELINIDWITNWKLRAAYAEAGIQPSRYARQAVYSTTSVGGATALSNSSPIRNESLGVERTKELEIGTDLILTPGVSGPWFSKIDLTFSYWQRKSEDIITTAPSPLSRGAYGTIDNLVSLSGKGLDISVDIAMLKSPKLSWNTGFRFGTAETLVDRISNGLDLLYGNLLREGQPVGAFYGNFALASITEKRPDGQFYIPESQQSEFEVTSTQYGPLVVNKLTHLPVLSDAADQRILGNPQPKFFGSFINDFVLFKNLKINMQWDVVYGNKIANGTRKTLYRDNHSKDFDLPVTINGQTGAWVAMYNGLYVGADSFFMEDGSFARLRSLSLTYDLAQMVKWGWAKQLSLTLAARNLLTITNYRGQDPESVSKGFIADGGVNYGPSRGRDSFGFPNLRSYQISLTFGF